MCVLPTEQVFYGTFRFLATERGWPQERVDRVIEMFRRRAMRRSSYA